MPRKKFGASKEYTRGQNQKVTLVLVGRGHADLTTSQRVIYNTLSRRD